MKRAKLLLPAADVDRIIQMAWEDRTPFEAIKIQFGLGENDVIKLMQRHLLRSSFKLWRERVNSRKTKHRALRDKEISRFKCKLQRSISQNRISKR